MSSVSHDSPVEELAAFLARRPSAEEVAAFRLSDAALDHIHALMDKNEDGTLTPEESRELDRLILLDDVIGLIQSYAPLNGADGPLAGTETPKTETGA